MLGRDNTNILNALIKWAMLLSVAHFFSQAAAQTESYKSIIKKAENLILQRDRLKATQLLVQALSREGAGSAVGKEIKQKLNQASDIFFSEAAQKLYEQARSLRLKDEALAEDRLTEAQNLEPYNLQIFSEKMKSLISQGKCQGVAEEVDEKSKINPLRQGLQHLKLWSFHCNGEEVPSPAELRSQFSSKLSAKDMHLQFLVGLGMMKQDKSAESLNLANEIIAKNLTHPAGYYLRWKVLSSWGQRATSEARKYLDLCKSTKLIKLNDIDQTVLYCKNMKEVDNYLTAEVKATQDE